MATAAQILKEISDEYGLSSEQVRTLPTTEEVVHAFRTCAEECGQYAKLAMQESLNCVVGADKETATQPREKKYKLAEENAARANRFSSQMHTGFTNARTIRSGNEEGLKCFGDVLRSVIQFRRGESVKQYVELMVHFQNMGPL